MNDQTGIWCMPSVHGVFSYSAAMIDGGPGCASAVDPGDCGCGFEKVGLTRSFWDMLCQLKLGGTENGANTITYERGVR